MDKENLIELLEAMLDRAREGKAIFIKEQNYLVYYPEKTKEKMVHGVKKYTGGYEKKGTEFHIAILD